MGNQIIEATHIDPMNRRTARIVVNGRYKTANEFFAYMQEWKQIVCNPVKLKLKKMK